MNTDLPHQVGEHMVWQQTHLQRHSKYPCQESTLLQKTHTYKDIDQSLTGTANTFSHLTYKRENITLFSHTGLKTGQRRLNWQEHVQPDRGYDHAV